MPYGTPVARFIAGFSVGTNRGVKLLARYIRGHVDGRVGVFKARQTHSVLPIGLITSSHRISLWLFPLRSRATVVRRIHSHNTILRRNRRNTMPSSLLTHAQPIRLRAMIVAVVSPRIQSRSLYSTTENTPLSTSTDFRGRTAFFPSDSSSESEMPQESPYRKQRRSTNQPSAFEKTEQTKPLIQYS